MFHCTHKTIPTILPLVTSAKTGHLPIKDTKLHCPKLVILIQSHLCNQDRDETFPLKNGFPTFEAENWFLGFVQICNKNGGWGGGLIMRSASILVRFQYIPPRPKYATCKSNPVPSPGSQMQPVHCLLIMIKKWIPA
jgi:hypothetical protein